MFVALSAAVPTEDLYAEDAHARSEEELAAAELVHSLWTPADCSVEPQAYDLAPAVAPAELWAVDSALVYSARAGSVAPWVHPSAPAYSPRADLDVLTEHPLAPVDYSEQAGRSAQRYFLDVRPVCWPVAEPRRDSPERYKACPLVSRV